MSLAHRARPFSETSHQRRGDESSCVDSRAIRDRSDKIRNAWSPEERAKRAYTARMVQWLLLGPPVGFRLEAE
jgi:hypothetical protein